MKKFYNLLFAVFLVLLLAACGSGAEGESEEQTTADGNESSEEVDSDDENTENEDVAEETEEPEKETEKPTEEEESAEQEELTVGDTAKFDGMNITLNEARIEPGGEFDEPQNAQFVAVNLTAENTTDEEQTMSSVMNVELKDAEAYSYSTTILTEGIQAQFDGSIDPGGTLRGEIPFDVPESDTYELHFSDPFQSGKAIWTIPSDQLTE